MLFSNQETSFRRTNYKKTKQTLNKVGVDDWLFSRRFYCVEISIERKKRNKERKKNVPHVVVLVNNQPTALNNIRNRSYFIIFYLLWFVSFSFCNDISIFLFFIFIIFAIRICTQITNEFFYLFIFFFFVWSLPL